VPVADWLLPLEPEDPVPVAVAKPDAVSEAPAVAEWVEFEAAVDDEDDVEFEGVYPAVELQARLYSG
jgi:hypothetical protein